MGLKFGGKTKVGTLLGLNLADLKLHGMSTTPITILVGLSLAICQKPPICQYLSLSTVSFPLYSIYQLAVNYLLISSECSHRKRLP